MSFYSYVIDPSKINEATFTGGLNGASPVFGLPTSTFSTPAFAVTPPGGSYGSGNNGLQPSSGGQKVASFNTFTWFRNQNTYSYIELGLSNTSSRISWSNDQGNSVMSRLMFQSRKSDGNLNGGIRIWENGNIQIGYEGNVDDRDTPPTVATLDVNGNAYFATGLKPASLTDAAAPSNTIYFSTTQNKLVYKDASNVVNNLY